MKIFTRTNPTTIKNTLEIFRQEIKRERKSFLYGAILIPVSQFLYLVILPLLISFVIQVIVEGQYLERLWWLIGGMVVTSVVAIITNQIGFNEMFYHQERVVSRLLDRALRALMNHSQSFFANQKVGSLANDVNTFSRSYLVFMDTVFLQLAGIAVSYISSLIVIAFVAPILLLPLTALTGFIIWHSIKSMVSRSPFRNRRKKLESQLMGQVADVLGNQTLVRLFGHKNIELEMISAERKKIVSVANQEIMAIQQNAKIRQTVLFSFQIATIVLIIWLYQNQLVSIGATIFIITYLARITSTMFNITGIIRSLEQSFLDAAKITDMLEITPGVIDAPESRQLRLGQGRIKFDNVQFHYEDAKGENVFEQLNLEVEPYTRVGLVGKSGGGKTTLTGLLLRYNDVTSGSIAIDDQNISLVTQDSLRSAISYVPQEPYLFHRSLRENIAYGKLGASDDEIIDAAKKAHAMEFIDKMPDGLDTIVGERGVKLSGGQRQRIAIARAILKDAPILVLDEATSALDSESEKLIQASLDELMKDRTSIVIAHRLSTIAKLDRIVVLDDGKIVEDGTHQQLLSASGHYARLWNHQSGGFIDE